MTAEWTAILCGISALACALVSGVFLTFSDFVMRALWKAEPAAGMEAMQIINREVFRTLFMVLLLGMAPLSLAWVAVAHLQLSGDVARYVNFAAWVYVIGVFGVTLLCNVPMNNRLDRLSHTNADAQAYWTRQYYPRWTMWNDVRTLAASVSAVAYALAGIQFLNAA
jgi:uncharacterized membrane protein